MAPRTTSLSSLDQVMPRQYIRVALGFETDHHGEAIAALQNGLNNTCNQLPYLKGNVFESENSRRQLNIVTADDDASPRIRDQPAPEYMPSYRSLTDNNAPAQYFSSNMFPFSTNLDHSGRGEPILGANCFRLDGGLILTVALHHNVGDGSGLGILLRLWAENMSVNHHIHIPSGMADPSKRQMLLIAATQKEYDNSSLRSMGDLLGCHPEYRLTLPGKLKAVSPTSTPPSGGCHLLRIPKAKLDLIKASLINHIPMPSLTINNILTAFLWTCITRIRTSRAVGAITASSSKMGFAVDGRRVLGFSDWKPGYLGNVNLFGLAELPVAELQISTAIADDQGVLEIALNLQPAISAIAAATSRITASSIVEVLSLVEQSPIVSDIIPGWDAFFGPDLSVTSWANMGVYDLDFGAFLGKPDFLRVPAAKIDGLVIILPRRRREQLGENLSDVRDEEVIEVMVYLREDDLEHLVKSEALGTLLK